MPSLRQSQKPRDTTLWGQENMRRQSVPELWHCYWKTLGGKHWSPISFSSDTGTTRSNSSVALSVRGKIQGLKRSER